ncbi:hypothetical protein P3342_002132 [Pyrenophora teres f. teres]|nr:hypothetical protein P3342_002132 [Pyrenophora teres f. teres]
MASGNKVVAFIGLGVMGYPMALNPRKGLDSSYTLLIYDVPSLALESSREMPTG